MDVRFYADEISELITQVYVPAANCGCHICAPCADCADNAFTREAVRLLSEAIKESEMNNASLVYAMLLPDAITVKVRYVMSFNGDKPNNQPSEYTYKALISMGLKAGDTVVVPIKIEGEIVFRTATVLSVDEFLDVNSTRDYHWVVSKVDTTAYDELRAKEKVVAKHMQLAERERQRKELLAQLALSYESENAMRAELGLDLVEPASGEAVPRS